MNSKTLSIGMIAITALMLTVSTIAVSDVTAKSVSSCTNNGDQSSEGSCKGNTDKNNKCQDNHAGNSFNSKVKSQEGSGC
ncbi:hypothetical protein BH23THE1_BH23THE1_34510 [soil metagenome]